MSVSPPGHSDGISVLAKHPRHLQYLFSGACDGEVRVWSLPTHRCVYHSVLHRGFVQGLCVNPAGDAFISVGQDKTIKICALVQSWQPLFLLGHPSFAHGLGFRTCPATRSCPRSPL